MEEERIWCIYKHTCLYNGKPYIGKTHQKINRRWRDGGKGYNTQLKFWRAIKKYGWNGFRHEILNIILTEDEANRLEKYYIKFFDCIKNGYNCREGGEGGRISEEAKKKISIANKGRTSYWKGKCLPDEVKKKISITKKEKNIHLTEEQKNNLRIKFSGKNNPFYGKKHTLKNKQKMSELKKGKNNPMYGRHQSEEMKEKLKQANLKEKNPAYNTGIPIICIDTDEIFVNIRRASEKYHIEPSSITKNCKGKLKSVKGLHFMYLSEYNKQQDLK